MLGPESKNQALGKGTQGGSKAAVYFDAEFPPAWPVQRSRSKAAAACPWEMFLEPGLPRGAEDGHGGWLWDVEAW